MSSSSTSFHVFAIAGAIGGSGNDGPSGSLGSFIVDELLKAGAEVHVLARAASAETPRAVELRSQGVKISVVDYKDPASVEKALKEVDVIVSALAGGGLEFQTVLADSGKAAGVKLFVPSEFGFDTTSVDKDSPLYGKRKVQDHLRSIELPYALFLNGLFAEWVGGALAVNDGKIEIVGDGKPAVSFASRSDIARYLAHVLTTLPPSELNHRIFRVEGSRASLNELLPLVEKKSGKVEVVHISIDDALERFKTKGVFFDYIKAQWARGVGVPGTQSEVEETSALFKDWNPKPVQSFL